MTWLSMCRIDACYSRGGRCCIDTLRKADVVNRNWSRRSVISILIDAAVTGEEQEAGKEGDASGFHKNN